MCLLKAVFASRIPVTFPQWSNGFTWSQQLGSTIPIYPTSSPMSFKNVLFSRKSTPFSCKPGQLDVGPSKRINDLAIAAMLAMGPRDWPLLFQINAHNLNSDPCHPILGSMRESGRSIQCTCDMNAMMPHPSCQRQLGPWPMVFLYSLVKMPFANRVILSSPNFVKVNGHGREFWTPKAMPWNGNATTGWGSSMDVFPTCPFPTTITFGQAKFGQVRPCGHDEAMLYQCLSTHMQKWQVRSNYAEGLQCYVHILLEHGCFLSYWQVGCLRCLQMQSNWKSLSKACLRMFVLDWLINLRTEVKWYLSISFKMARTNLHHAAA